MKTLFSIIFAIIFLCANLVAKEEQRGSFSGAKHTTMPSWFLNSFLDLNEDIESLTKENKRLIVFAHQDNCPYCNRFVYENLTHLKTKEILLKYFGMLDINMFGNKEVIDVDEEEYSEKIFALKHKIQFTPTLIFYNEKKEQILRLNGYINIEDFLKALIFIKDKKESSIDFFDYLAQEKKSKQNLIIKDDIFISSKNLMPSKKTKAIAVLFEKDNCLQCQKLKIQVLENAVNKSLLKQFDTYKINVKHVHNIATPKKFVQNIQSWTKELKIQHFPTLILFNEKGKEIIRVEASFKNFHLQSIFDYVLSDAYKTEKEFQRYLTKRVEKIIKEGKDVNIWE